MSVDRYGINKVDSGPLAKACFEETEKVLLKAALYGEMDPVTGVSANIMTGQPIRAGTAYTQILLDETALTSMLQQLPEEAEAEEEDDIPSNDTIQRVFVESATDVCNQISSRMHMVLPQTVSEGVEEEEDQMELVVLDSKKV
jgi:DNA-directed RNA polymerase beta' subunit